MFRDQNSESFNIFLVQKYRAFSSAPPVAS